MGWMGFLTSRSFATLVFGGGSGTAGLAQLLRYLEIGPEKVWALAAVAGCMLALLGSILMLYSFGPRTDG